MGVEKVLRKKKSGVEKVLKVKFVTEGGMSINEFEEWLIKEIFGQYELFWEIDKVAKAIIERRDNEFEGRS